MKAIILALIPIACAAVGFILGSKLRSTDSKHYEKLYTASTTRLQKADTLISSLAAQANEHVTLGDVFAMVAQDEIRKYWRSEGQTS